MYGYMYCSHTALSLCLFYASNSYALRFMENAYYFSGFITRLLCLALYVLFCAQTSSCDTHAVVTRCV